MEPNHRKMDAIVGSSVSHFVPAAAYYSLQPAMRGGLFSANNGRAGRQSREKKEKKKK